MIVQGQCSSFKREQYSGYHAFNSAYRAADTFKIALYTSAATLNKDTTVYSATNEVVAVGYSAGGQVLVPTVSSSGDVGWVTFANVSWSAALTAAGALIYNSSQGNRAVAVLSFGNDKTSQSVFLVQFPAGDPLNAIIRTT